MGAGVEVMSRDAAAMGAVKDLGLDGSAGLCGDICINGCGFGMMKEHGQRASWRDGVLPRRKGLYLMGSSSGQQAVALRWHC